MISWHDDRELAILDAAEVESTWMTRTSSGSAMEMSRTLRLKTKVWTSKLKRNWQLTVKNPSGAHGIEDPHAAGREAVEPDRG